MNEIFAPYNFKKSPKRKQKRKSTRAYVPARVISTTEETLERIHQFQTDPQNRLTRLYCIQSVLDEALASAAKKGTK